MVSRYSSLPGSRGSGSLAACANRHRRIRVRATEKGGKVPRASDQPPAESRIGGPEVEQSGAIVRRRLVVGAVHPAPVLHEVEVPVAHLVLRNGLTRRAALA